jgi:hypothetical protein
MQEGFAAQRAGITEATVDQERSAIQAALAQGKGAVAGGNYQQALTPGTSQLPSTLASSDITRGLAEIEQRNKIIAMALGGGVETGNQAVQAGHLQLAGITNMPNYNPWAAGITGALSGAYGVYGAMQNRNRLPMGTSYQSFVGNAPLSALPMSRRIS